MIPARVFSMNQSVVQAIYSEGRGRIPVSVACFNYSIAEVWTANTCLTTACFANNGTVAGVKSMRRIITVLLSTTDDTNNTWRTLDQSDNPTINSSSPTGKKKHASGGLGFGDF